jgi:hypothetical protein
VTTITRSDVLRRAHTLWSAGSVPYSQIVLHWPDGYRADCSGYVAMCWAAPLNGHWGGPNTVTLVTGGLMREINPNDLKPGDAVGRCGPGTDGDAGHIRLFTAWLNTDPNDSHYYCLEQTGGGNGPTARWSTGPTGTGRTGTWTSWRTPRYRRRRPRRSRRRTRCTTRPTCTARSLARRGATAGSTRPSARLSGRFSSASG